MALEKYIIKGDQESPSITLDAESGVFEVVGISRPEDVTKVYDPVVNWLWHYSKSINPKTVFNFRFDYFNTASAKSLYDIMLVLDDIHNDGYEVEVNWYFETMDIDMKGAGEEFNDMVELEINMIEVKE